MNAPERRKDGDTEVIWELFAARRKARRRMLGKVVLARDEERRRIALELHGSPLRSIAEVADRVRELRLHVEPALSEELAGLERCAVEALESLQDLTYELSLIPVDEHGLAGALRHQLQRIKDEIGIHYAIDNRMWTEPPPEARVTLYRIAEEALSNVRRHAAANHVEVLLESEDGFRARISDDGIGFRDETLAAGPGALGIALMRQRAEAAGGWFEVRSTPGTGTAVEFAVPARSDEPLPSRVR